MPWCILKTTRWIASITDLTKHASQFILPQTVVVSTYQKTVHIGGYTEVLHDSLNEIDQVDLEFIWQESGLNLNLHGGLPDSRRRRHIVKSWPK